MLKLLEFGMQNRDSKNHLFRMTARICLYLTKKWADHTERKLNQKWQDKIDLPKERAEEIKQSAAEKSKVSTA